MATHSRTLAWKIPWAEEPGRLQSMELQEWDMTEHLHVCIHYLISEIASNYLFMFPCSFVRSYYVVFSAVLLYGDRLMMIIDNQ